MNMEKIEARVMDICIDLHKKGQSPASATSKIMALVSFPPLPPLKWEETRSFQSSKCPLTSDSYSIWGSPDGWGCQMTPAKGFTVTSLGANLERPDAIAAIERHRNDNLKTKLGL